jgi:hypothetical protein
MGPVQKNQSTSMASCAAFRITIVDSPISAAKKALRFLARRVLGWARDRCTVGGPQPAHSTGLRWAPTELRYRHGWCRDVARYGGRSSRATAFRRSVCFSLWCQPLTRQVGKNQPTSPESRRSPPSQCHAASLRHGTPALARANQRLCGEAVKRRA